MNKNKWLNKIHQGDVLEILKQMPSNFVDTVITSPPYWSLRDYGVEKQVGLENHPQKYIDKLVGICREIKRVLKKSGSFYLVLGDTYYSSIRKTGIRDTNDETSTNFSGWSNWDGGIIRIGKIEKSNWLQPKQLLLVPSRVAIALQDDGWILRNDIIWYKSNAMPSPVKDRLNNTFEHVFHFVKFRKYYYDLDAIRVPHKTPKSKPKPFGIIENNLDRYDSKLSDIHKLKSSRNKHLKNIRGMKQAPEPNEPNAFHQYGKNPGDVIKHISGKYKDSDVHSAGGREFYWSKQRVFTPEQKKIAVYLKQYIADKKQQLNDVFGETKWQHWIRTDESGSSLPLPEDWSELKEILGFDDTYDKIMTETHMVPVTDASYPMGKNPGDFWDIITQPFPELHFAVFPPKLVETPIKASCPEWICKKCKKPRKRILKKTGRVQQHWAPGTDVKTEQATGKHGTTSTLVTGYKFDYKTVGWTDCRCGSGFEPGIVLDPFAGSGTTCLVAKQMGRKYIGIELNPEYVKMARRRLNKFVSVYDFLDDTISNKRMEDK